MPSRRSSERTAAARPGPRPPWPPPGPGRRPGPGPTWPCGRRSGRWPRSRPPGRWPRPGPPHDPVDQAEPVGLGRGDAAAGEDQVLGHRPAHPPDQQLGAAPGRDQAEADLGQPEGGVVGGHHQVAGQGQLGAAAEGEAGHGRHRRQGRGGRTAANPRRNASRCTNQPWSSKPARCLRSAPTQKARSPAPVRTTARTPGRWPAAPRRRPAPWPARSRSRSAPPAGRG